MKFPPKYLAYLGLALMVAGLLSACGVNSIVGSGNVITEERSIDGFDEIEFNFVGTLMLAQGDETTLTIEGDDNIVEMIRTTVRGDRLVIDAQSSLWGLNLRSAIDLTYTITTPTLEKLDLTGAGDVYADGFTAEDLALEISGAGSLDFSQLRADELKIELNGAGSVDLIGAVESLQADLSGMGSLEAGDLASTTAKVDINGAGSAELWVSELLEAEISGAGSIDYYGEPEVVQKISGLGSVDGLGSKE